MSIIVPHNCVVVRHATVPYLWRITCGCGYKAFAPDWEKALLCKQTHLESEEPFPDLSFLSDPEPSRR